MDDSNHLLGITPSEVLDLGNIAIGQEFFILLKNALDRLPFEDIIELKSSHAQLQNDIKSWCKLRGNTLLTQWMQEIIIDISLKKQVKFSLINQIGESKSRREKENIWIFVIGLKARLVPC
ncbi:hypothetical protein HHO41_20380 [Bacillus sp. DNRA2]|uniref:hypothetical protein n=1 Tax=Bacillus sp. DNRA2 TaxID=2723053 RepID=UPI00145F3940|nr:hypothetical protein [Bacillus sp. DNRA2]NMD72598.1 hypothetical protein [Bacillus sp. DNRA2]